MASQFTSCWVWAAPWFRHREGAEGEMNIMSAFDGGQGKLSRFMVLVFQHHNEIAISLRLCLL